MARVNDPQRVITRGKTRTIGEPRRAREGADTVGIKGEPRVTSRPADRTDTGQDRLTQGEARPAREARPVPTAEPSPPAKPMREASATRPLERIEALEQGLERALARVAELERDMYGKADDEEIETEPIGVLAVLADVEAVLPKLSETLGGLVETVGGMGDEQTAPSGLVHAAAVLAEQVQEIRQARPGDTIQPPAPLEPEQVES